MRLLNSTGPDFPARLSDLLGRRRKNDPALESTVSRIVSDIEQRGDEALRELTTRYDQHCRPLRVTPDELSQAEESLDPGLAAALELAIKRVTAYHKHQRPEDKLWTDNCGVWMGWNWHPLSAVGLYIPGGTAGYPSSVIMNVVPAKIARVERIAIVTPSMHGKDCQSVLAAAAMLGVHEVYRIGGAQAIAALTMGTGSIPRVVKIFGPGNRWVTEAKRQVFGRVGIDALAGPSEITILADASQDPDLIAADLLSQAEHGPDTQSILITPCPALAEATLTAIKNQLDRLDRGSIAQTALKDNGALVIVPSMQDGLDIVARIAPEHLELLCASRDDAHMLARAARHVGSVFIGPNTPEALGDYLAGPNHVLPTFGSARFSSGLGVPDFMRRTSYLDAGTTSDTLLHNATVIAEAEGLTAHAHSLRLRQTTHRDSRCVQSLKK